MIDLHSHIIFGVDDGASTFEESVKMLHLAYESGTRTIVATPHVRVVGAEAERRHWELIQKHYFELTEYLENLLPELTLLLGAEILVTETDCEHNRYLWNTQQCYGIAGTRYLLIEFPYYFSYENIKAAITSAKLNGWVPIVAHVELYKCLRGTQSRFRLFNFKGHKSGYFRTSFFRVKALIKMGALIQITTGSLLGKLDKETMRWVRKAVRLGFVDFIASDAHSSSSRKPILDQAYDWVVDQNGEAVAQGLFVKNQKEILEGILE